MNKKTILSVVLLSIFPIISFAALDGLKGLLTDILNIISNDVIPLIFAIALLFFFWGVGQFIVHSGEPKIREEGKQKMLWGIIALFVMVSIYGILKLVGDTIGIQSGSDIQLPTLQ